MLIFAIVVIVLLYFVQWYLQFRNRMYHWKKLPCKQSDVLFGELRDFIKIFTIKKKYHPEVYFLERILDENRRHEQEGLTAFWIGVTPLVTVFCPELAEKVLGKSASLDRSFNYSYYQQWLGVALFTSTGAKWRSRRKLLNPCFHPVLLDDFLPVFDEQSRILVAKIEQDEQREDLHVGPLVALCTLDIVCETLMGVSLGAQKGMYLDYTEAVQKLGDPFNQRLIRPWLQHDFLFNLSQFGRAFNRDMRTVQDFTRKVFQQQKEAVLHQDPSQRSTEGRRAALMDPLFEGGQLSDEEIQREVLAFLFAGHETIAAGVTFALHCLGLHPEVQERVHEEIDALFQGDEARAVTKADVGGMKYTERVIKESQRIYPTVPIVGRKISGDIQHRGFVIPSGTDVYVNILSLHRQPDSFPEPDVFDPDRFLPENTQKRHPYAYVPFAAGPRKCIGQGFALLVMKVLLANILRRFRIVSLETRPPVMVEITLKPAVPLRIQFLPRTPATRNLV